MLIEMTTYQKVGQLLMGQIFGTALTKGFERFIREYPLGGYRICQDNIISPEQLRSFIEQINGVFSSMRLPFPIIATDEEGGTLCVFRGIIQDFPGTMALGATRNEALSFQQARHIAYQMRQMGLTMNFVPVCDTNLIPENTVVGIRAFSDQPELCSKLAVAAARGTNAGGILNCAKHFPGHGGTSADTHYSLATDEHDAKTVEQLETAGFLGCIRMGVDAVFASHVLYPAVDADWPASLSKVWLTEILRTKLGFRGAILSDDLMMNAIAQRYGTQSAPLMHLLAGGDMAMLCGDSATVSEAYEALYQAVMDGRLSFKRLDSSFLRVQALKERAAQLFNDATPGMQTGEEITRAICGASATLLSGGENLPLSTGKRVLILCPKTINLTQSDTSQQIQIHLSRFLSCNCMLIEQEEYSLDLRPEEQKLLAQKALGFDYVIQLTMGALRFPEQAELFNALPRKKAVAILIREPYDAMILPQDATIICVYSGIDASMENVADILFGRTGCRGVCPVRLLKGEAK